MHVVIPRSFMPCLAATLAVSCIVEVPCYLPKEALACLLNRGTFPPVLSLSGVSGNKASFRFTVQRTSFKAMHYAMDCLDLDVIFPTITGPVPLAFRTQVGSIMEWLGVIVCRFHILAFTNVWVTYIWHVATAFHTYYSLVNSL